MKRFAITCDAACSAACNGEVLALNQLQAFKLFKIKRQYCSRAIGCPEPILTVISEEVAHVVDFDAESVKTQTADMQVVIKCLQQLDAINGELVNVCVYNADTSKEEFIKTTVAHAVALIRTVCLMLEAGLEKVIVEGAANEATTDRVNDGGVTNG